MARRERLTQRVGQVVRRRRPWVIGGGVGLVVVVAVVVWLVWPDAPDRTPRALEYQDFDVCLLVDNGGIRAGTAAAAWAGMQAAVADTKVRLSYLSVNGPQTEEQARLFVPTLVQQGCDVVVAVGANQARAAQAVGSDYPDVHFLVVESEADVDEAAAKVSSLLPPV